MKKIFVVFACVMTLVACSKEAHTEALNHSDAPQEIKLGHDFLITNELNNKDIKLQAFETNLSKDGEYYYQIEIHNASSQPINIKTNQIVLVDTAGTEHRVKLIDQELIAAYDINQSKSGIIAFDDLGQSSPKFLKIKN